MQIYGRDVLSSDELWELYQRMIQTSELWNPETFKEAAKKCGFSRVAIREGYFSFSGKNILLVRPRLLIISLRKFVFLLVMNPKT
ncbi:hypothetical protein F966_02814 [Acinetobacter higginsii]|uniref:Uncharacterized protein n=1 Tax=Acinetobacter higginsii TaxID=70347 RepID=N8XI16_9GAMM|nr:hypothetical protein [Acinetobacter higginsii]ENV08699.1 hypothetical protein F966_02814 [Acinetobacter higginsii]